jgi:hypothetical protein
MKFSRFRVIAALWVTFLFLGCAPREGQSTFGRSRLSHQQSVNGNSPGNLGYSRNPAVYVNGVDIEPNVPNVEGGVPTLFSVDPKLPAGLTLDSTTGVLTGTPTILSAEQDYTVTALSNSGMAQTALTMKVVSRAPFVTNGEVRALALGGDTLYLGGTSRK